LKTSAGQTPSIQNNQPPDIVIEPGRRWLDLRLGEIWKYRELLYFLVWRDLKVRYKQSVLGVLWIVLQPLLTMLVFTLLFNRILNVETGTDIPYPIFSYSGLLPWTYFSTALSKVTLSLVQDKNLLTKIYFPRLIIPLAGVLPGLVDFAIAFVILIGLMFYYQIIPDIRTLLLPVAMLLAVITALGTGLWFSALNVQYRDIQHIIPFFIQVWMFMTPIIYPITRIPEQWLWLYTLNPMVGVVQVFRAVLLNEPTALQYNGLSIIVSLILLFTGTIYFRRMERIFADVV
jgi:lipopolysaccharide transport system permease protein